MARLSEEGDELFLIQDIGIRIHILVIHDFSIEQMIADFIGRVAQHEIDLLCASGDTAQNNRETVAAGDREYNTDILSAEFFSDIFRDVIDGAVVALASGNDGLRNGENIAVTDGEFSAFSSFENSFNDDGFQIITGFDDRSSETSDCGTD